MSKQKCPYSTYQKIPSTALQKLKDFCSANHITINNGLSAIVALAIKHACGHEYQSENKHIVMNLIKSQRDNSLYDQSVGCILRVDTVKVALKEYNDLRSLAKQIRQSIIDTSNYQHCPSLIKFSAMNTLAKYQKKWVDFLIKPMAKLATRLVQMPLIYRNVINQSIARLMFFKRHKYFVINLNVRPNFINNSGNPTSLFGLAPISGPHQEDLLTIDHVLEVCFLYEECEKTAYIVVSGNLQPAFRTCIADEIIRLMQKAMTEFEPALCAEESSTISEKINGSVGA
ncbi:MAG: hypothetical protein J0I93_12215 [Legionella sp.]|nr:hypothetical protein [Legionella sp.]